MDGRARGPKRARTSQGADQPSADAQHGPVDKALQQFNSEINKAVHTYMDTLRTIEQQQRAVAKLEAILMEGQVPKSLRSSITLSLPAGDWTHEFQQKATELQTNMSRQLATLVVKARTRHVTELQHQLATVETTLKQSVKGQIKSATDALQGLLRPPRLFTGAGAGSGAGAGATAAAPTAAPTNPGATMGDPDATAERVAAEFNRRCQPLVAKHMLSEVRRKDTDKRREAKRQAARQAATTADTTMSVKQMVDEAVRQKLQQFQQRGTKQRGTKTGRPRQGNERGSGPARRTQTRTGSRSGPRSAIKTKTKTSSRGRSNSSSRGRSPKPPSGTKYRPPHLRRGSSGRSGKAVRFREDSKRGSRTPRATQH